MSEGGANTEAQEGAQEKLTVEVDKGRLDGLIRGYEAVLRRADRSDDGVIIPHSREGSAVLKLTREFFDIIGQPGMTQAAENRQMVQDLKESSTK